LYRLLAFAVLIVFNIRLTQPAFADGYLGLALYAATNSRFPCDQALDSLQDVQKPALSILWGTFGNSQSCVSKFLSRFKDRTHLLQIHFSNETCRFNQRCSNDELFPKIGWHAYGRKLQLMDEETKAVIQARTQTILDTLIPLINDNTKLVLSIGLEDLYFGTAATNLTAAIKEIWPYEVSRNPKFRAMNIDYIDYQELHGVQQNFAKNPVKCIVNQDGIDADLGAGAKLKNAVTKAQIRSWIKKWRASCDAVFLWRAEWQGVSEKYFVKPPRRNFRFPDNDVTTIQSLLK